MQALGTGATQHPVQGFVHLADLAHSAGLSQPLLGCLGWGLQARWGGAAGPWPRLLPCCCREGQRLSSTSSLGAPGPLLTLSKTESRDVRGPSGNREEAGVLLTLLGRIFAVHDAGQAKVRDLAAQGLGHQDVGCP